MFFPPREGGRYKESILLFPKGRGEIYLVFFLPKGRGETASYPPPSLWEGGGKEGDRNKNYGYKI